MKVIVCGAGRVGFSIATYLERFNNDVVVIDKSAKLVRHIAERHDMQAIEGFASDPAVLKRAGAEDADLLVAVTQHDEVNMISCEVAHALFDVPKKIARVRNQAYLNPEWRNLFDNNNISIDVTISPEVEVARSIARSLTVPGALSVSPLSEKKVYVIGVKCTQQTPVVNTPLTHITSLFPLAELNVVAMKRQSYFFIPDQKEKLLDGDEVYFTVFRDKIPHAMQVFGYEDQSSHRVVILGGGNVGVVLAEALHEKDEKIITRIVELQEDRAQQIARDMDDIEVLQGDALTSDVLLEAGIAITDTVVAVTEDDRVNILGSLLAKRLGAKRAMALINNPSSNPLVSSLGVDSVINPREVTVSSVLRHVRRGHIQSVYTICEGLGEIIDATVDARLGLAGAELIDIEVPGEIKLAAVVRDGEVFFPYDSMTIEMNDRLIIMAKHSSVAEVEKIFSPRVDY
ncbi:MAG: Trk system potassium transporter TrkA [Alphaproteobacteria bacterium]